MADQARLEELRELMEDVFDCEDLEISRDTTAEDVEEWDSLSHVRLIVAIERFYGIRFSNAEVEAMENVGALLDKINEKRS